MADGLDCFDFLVESSSSARSSVRVEFRAPPGVRVETDTLPCRSVPSRRAGLGPIQMGPKGSHRFPARVPPPPPPSAASTAALRAQGRFIREDN
ncbi:hypothetical protein NL676_019935 [Syzygium grande]|nr:hypothetical protein NL676_019935 [Syzygium grande]